MIKPHESDNPYRWVLRIDGDSLENFCLLRSRNKLQEGGEGKFNFVLFSQDMPDSVKAYLLEGKQHEDLSLTMMGENSNVVEVYELKEAVAVHYKVHKQHVYDIEVEIAYSQCVQEA